MKIHKLKRKIANENEKIVKKSLYLNDSYS